MIITSPESGSGGSDGSSCDNGVDCHQKHKHNSSAAIDCCACPGIVVSKYIILYCWELFHTFHIMNLHINSGQICF